MKQKIFKSLIVAAMMLTMMYGYGQNDLFDLLMRESFSSMPATGQEENGDGYIIPSLELEPPLMEQEQHALRKLLMPNCREIIYDDDRGRVIYKQANGRYGYISIRFFSMPVVTDKDEITLMSYPGMQNKPYLLVKDSASLSVYTYDGYMLIPPIKADSLISVSKNTFKSVRRANYGYALYEYEGKLYTVNTKGNCHLLEMERPVLRNNLIYGYKNDSIYVYDTDTSLFEEGICSQTDEKTVYAEVEVLDMSNHVRYEYEGIKYGNITPGIVIKKNRNYYLYPGNKKLKIKEINKTELVGTSKKKKVIFSKHLFPIKELQKSIEENANR